jgi:hypothetical protein
MRGGEAGQVVGLWRYPVKSMAGEPLRAAEVSWHGLAGDRRWAFIRDGLVHSDFPRLTIRERPDMCHYRPSFRDPARPDASPTTVRTPAGAELDVADEALAAELGAGVRVMKQQRGVFARDRPRARSLSRRLRLDGPAWSGGDRRSRLDRAGPVPLSRRLARRPPCQLGSAPTRRDAPCQRGHDDGNGGEDRDAEGFRTTRERRHADQHEDDDQQRDEREQPQHEDALEDLAHDRRA